MSKRIPNNNPRHENEAWYTPVGPILKLVPYLIRDDVRTFADPCCGDGAIVRALDAAGFMCVSASDIIIGQDARTVQWHAMPDCAITNPPYDRSRKLMKAIIDSLRRRVPTWALLESDFAFNQGSKALLACCSDIVVVGRIRWIPGTDNHGTANYAWFRFQATPCGICLHPWCSPGDEPLL